MVCVVKTITNNNCKFIQFVVIFLFLKLGQPLIDFEKMKQLFKFLKVKNTPYKHWCDSTN